MPRNKITRNSSIPCHSTFAAAKNFIGFAAFARVFVDDSPETVKALAIATCPTFIMHRY